MIPLALLRRRRGSARSVASGFALVIAALSASLTLSFALVTIALVWLAFALIALMKTEEDGAIFTSPHRQLAKPVSV